MKMDIGNTFVRINDFAQDKAFVGLTTATFDSGDQRGIFKLGLIYLTCGEWLPPDHPNASIFIPDPVDTDTDTDTEEETEAEEEETEEEVFDG